MGSDEDITVIERDCGIEYDRIDAWVTSSDLLGCTVTLTPKPNRKLSKTVSLSVTTIRFEGPTQAVAELYHRFELNFMSAGG